MSEEKDSNPFKSILTSGSQDILCNHGDGCIVENVKASPRIQLNVNENHNNPKSKSMNRRKSNWLSEIDMKCELCPFSTRYKCDFRRHKARHVTASFPCQHCNMPFATAGHMNGHIRTAHDKNTVAKPFKCSICNYETNHTSDIHRHRRRHEECLVECRHCRRPYLDEDRYKTHLRKHHGPDSAMDFEEMKDAWENFKNKKHEKIRKETLSKPEQEFKKDLSEQMKGAANMTKMTDMHNELHVVELRGDVCQSHDTKTQVDEEGTPLRTKRKHKHTFTCKSKKKHRSSKTAYINSNCSKRPSGNIIEHRANETFSDENATSFKCENYSESKHSEIKKQSPMKLTKHIMHEGEPELKESFRVKKVSDHDNESCDENEDNSTEKEVMQTKIINYDTHAGKTTYEDEERPKPNNVARNAISCVFCDYEAHSYRDLTQHLDDHDMDELFNKTDETPLHAEQTRSSVGYRTSSATEDDGYDEDSDTADDNDDETENPRVTSDTKLKDRSVMNGKDVAEKYKREEGIEGKTSNDVDTAENITERNQSANKDENPRDSQSIRCGNTIMKDDVEAKHKTKGDHKDSSGYPEVVSSPYACTMCAFRTADVGTLTAHVDGHNMARLKCKDNQNESSDLTSVSYKHERRLDKKKDKYAKNPSKNERTLTLNHHSNEDKNEHALVNRHRGNKYSDKDPGSTERRRSHAHRTETLTYFDKLTDRLSKHKQDLVRYKRFYVRRTQTFARHRGRFGSRYVYECMICTLGTTFGSSSEARMHYKRVHPQLRETICDTCSYCNRLFP
ncbi:zinc finger protein 271-like isoform X2 [Dreissena polymorpha]|uniref:C2H2-type domain-containing protein n=2 Tax=Dreissena polymorpha TaxID=45954 RepID=A0A9D4G2I1_DREPO|nr:zinc finger protein 271-like isoform X2 [Dreissena polymorpha]KAH3807959.1 hypothetical protein DPMN_136307 [Dreissena polymorpha]